MKVGGVGRGHPMRSLAFLLTLMAAYLLLRGYPELMPVLMRTCLAVLLLVGGLGFWGRRARPKERTAESRRRTSWIDYLAIGLAVLALECGFVLFFSAAPPPLEKVAAKIESIWRFGAKSSTEGSAAASRASSGNWLWNDHQNRPLPRRTNLKPGNRPEVYLRPVDEVSATRLLNRRIYVEAFALSRYQSGAWSTQAGVLKDLTAEPDGWLRLEGDRRGPNVECEVFHASEHANGNPLTGLQGIVAAEISDLKRLGPGLHLLPDSGEDGYQYRTMSKPATLDDILRGSPVDVPPDAAAVYLKMPVGDLGDRISSLAKVAVGEGTRREQLMRLRSHLRSTLSYSLQTDNVGDLDPIENFLFEEQRGHCEFFATAGALLARSLGIPSRVAYGWAGGTYYEGSSLFVFRAREAHAWTEVLLDGYGWTVLDATPPGALEHELAATAPVEDKPPGIEELGEDEVVEAQSRTRGLRAPIALAAGVAGCACLLFLWRARSATPGELEELLFGAPEANYFAAFRKASRRLGKPLSGTRTLRGFLNELESPPDFAAELQEYHYGVRYEGKAPDPRRERELRSKIEQWR